MATKKHTDDSASITTTKLEQSGDFSATIAILDSDTFETTQSVSNEQSHTSDGEQAVAPIAKPRGRPKAGATDDQISAALQATHGLLTPAAKVLGISRQALTKLLKPVHQALITDIRESITDAAEANLYKLIQLGDERSVQFWLTRQGKARGYSEKQEIKVESAGSPEDSKARREIITRLLKGKNGSRSD